MARANNFPQAGLEKIDPKTVQVESFKQLQRYAR